MASLDRPHSQPEEEEEEEASSSYCVQENHSLSSQVCPQQRAERYFSVVCSQQRAERSLNIAPCLWVLLFARSHLRGTKLHHGVRAVGYASVLLFACSRAERSLTMASLPFGKAQFFWSPSWWRCRFQVVTSASPCSSHLAGFLHCWFNWRYVGPEFWRPHSEQHFVMRHHGLRSQRQADGLRRVERSLTMASLPLVTAQSLFRCAHSNMWNEA